MLKRIAMSAAGLLFGVGTIAAADLDTFRRPPLIVEGIGPPPPGYLPLRRAPPSPCHVIAAPQFDLSQDDVVRTRPQVVCLSRGLYSDTFN